MTRARNRPPALGSSGLGFAFVRDLERDYREHGAALIAQFRKNEPRNYLRLLQSIAPQHANAEDRLLDQLTDEQLADLIRLVNEALAEKNSLAAAAPR